MNLRILTIEAMIAISGFLLNDAQARAVLLGHPLGAASLEQLRRAHDLLVALTKERADNEELVAALTAIITALDLLHDRKARSFYYHLRGLREGSDDDNLAALCDQLIERCFPNDLNVVNSAYVDEAGWVQAVRHMIDAPTMAQLAAVTVGPHTLAEILQGWLDAGESLGARVFERDRIETASSLTGAAAAKVNIVKVRSLWIRVMQAFLSNIDLLPLTREQREVLLSPIEQSIERALAGDAEPDADADTGTGDGGTGTDTDGDAGSDVLDPVSLSGELTL